MIEETNGYIKILDINRYIYREKLNRRSVGRLCRNDPILENYTILMKSVTNGGIQECLFIKREYVIIYLSKLNVKNMDAEERQRLKQLIDYYANLSLTISDDESAEMYSSEARLRDDLLEIGVFNNIYISNKEVKYDFGRIDLYGVDDHNNKCCIELKYQHGYRYTKSQMLRYRDSRCFDRIIYVAYSIPTDMLDWLKSNGFECYEYKRQLMINRIA